MRKFLLAAATLAIASPAFASPPAVWVNDGSWRVWQEPASTGQSCYLKHFEPTTAGFATFGFMQNDTHTSGSFVYSEPNMVFPAAGTITLQVDNFGPWTARARPSTDQALDIVDLVQDPTQFVQEIMWGNALYVTSANGVRAFSLAGSNNAIANFLNCITRITAERNNTAPPLAPPVVQSGPARVL